ncbi:MAG TPA: TolC family protein [Candidatus Angelobacter sp.]|nr:TolC family protein [Candidatus Angelobacter sp.]
MIASVFCAALALVQLMLAVAASTARAEPNGYSGSKLRDASRIESHASSNARLSALINEALRNSPIILAARSHWQALTRVPRQVSTLPDPTVGLTHFTVGSPQPFSGYETSDFYYSGFGFSQDIPGPGKLGLRAKQAQRDAEVAHDAYRLQQRQVAEQVREGYFNLFYLEKVNELLRQTREQLAGVAETAEAQYHVAMAQQQDVLKAQLEVTRILRDQELSRADFQQGQANLKAVLGREQDSANLAIDEVKPSVLPFDERRLRELAIDNSPDLQQATAMEQSSDAALEIARHNYVPDFNLGYAFQKTGPGFRDYYMLTVGATIPLYFWRKQTPAVEQAALEKESAHANTYSKRLSIGSELRTQAVALRSAERVMKLYNDGLIPQAEETQTSAQAAYRVGKVDFQTLLSAVIDVLRVKQEYYRTLADHEIAIAKIQTIVGDL